jgi:hypothetical protein
MKPGPPPSAASLRAEDKALPKRERPLENESMKGRARERGASAH